MKTAFRAKIIFETEEFGGYNKSVGDAPILTMARMYEIIRKKDFDIEVIDDFLTATGEPVIIIRHK